MRRGLAVMQQFRVIIQAVRQHYARVERIAGISGAQLSAMSHIADSPGLTVSGLAARLGLHQSTVSNLTARLDALGYVSRTRIRGDRRVVQLGLTPGGQRILRQAPQPAVGVLLQALGELPDEALLELHHQLEKLIAQLAVKDPSAARRPLSEA
jgi:DNA-binding MarR family transcriptional regulator